MSHRFVGWLLRGAATGVVIGATYTLSGLGFAGSADDPPKAEKKGADASKTDEKKPGIDPKDVRIGAPPELAELRTAVEEAARKGENVDEIRKQLDALEKALAGKAWVKPKVVEEPVAPRPFPGDPFPAFPGRVRPVPFPAFPDGGGLQMIQPDAELLRKAQELLEKAIQLEGDPAANREKIEALQREAQELMARALRPAIGGRLVLPVMPAMPLMPGGGGVRGGNSRLGVRVDQVPIALADQLDLPADRGVLVAEVLPDSVAEKAGLKASDVIVEFAGKPVSGDPTEFVRTVFGTKNGEKVDIGYFRKGKKAEAKAVPLADSVPAARLDLKRAPLPRADFAPPIDFNSGPARVEKRTGMSVSVQNGVFTIDAQQDGVKFHLEGQAEGKKVTPSKITVTDGDKKIDAKSIDELPAEYRDRAQTILDGVKVRK